LAKRRLVGSFRRLLSRLGRSWVSPSELCSAQQIFRNAVVLRPPKPDQ
jgi:hypothetical protein